MLPDLSIVIVTWNAESYIGECLAAVFEALEDIRAQVVVVDNRSTDRTVSTVKRWPEVKLICNDHNLGFAAGSNIGIKAASGRYIALLNPDTEVASNSFKTGIEYLDRHPRVGVLGAKLMRPDGHIQIPCTTTFRSIWDEFCIQLGLTKLFPKSRVFARHPMSWWDHSIIKEVDVVSGAFVMTRREVIDQCGGLDERLPMYGEEEDFCYRVKHNGWRVVYHPDVEILHYGGGSVNQLALTTPRLNMYLSHDYLARKHHRILGFLAIRGIRIIGFMIRGIGAFLYWGIARHDRGRMREYLRIYIKGLKIQVSRFPALAFDDDFAQIRRRQE
jgi:hypothetical protein